MKAVSITNRRWVKSMKHRHWQRRKCNRSNAVNLRTLNVYALTFLASIHSAMSQPMGQPPAASGGKAAESDPLIIAASRWDANHDGVFTCDEWKQYAERLFTRADKNADGFLNAREFQELGRIEPIFADAAMSYFDENHDQRISRKEFVEKPNPIFARYDANGDCRVTNDELKGSAAKRERPMGKPGNGDGAGGRGMGRF